jgi:hypothetical protein
LETTGSKAAFSVASSCPATATASRPPVATSASRSSGCSSACIVQLVARPAEGKASNASRTAGAAKLFTQRRILCIPSFSGSVPPAESLA